MLLCLIQTWLGGGTPSRPGQGYPWVPPSRPCQGGYPIQTWLGVPQVPPKLGWGPPLRWGTPRPGMGYPLPPTWTWDRYPLPRPGMGTPYLDLKWGTTPYPDLSWGTPHPCTCGQTENITSRHPSDAVGKNSEQCPFPRGKYRSPKVAILCTPPELKVTVSCSKGSYVSQKVAVLCHHP